MARPGSKDASDASLTSRAVKGAGWVFASRVFGRGLGLLKTLVLAGLLDPEDFGLFGVVMLAIAMVETFTQTGFGQALIQKQEDTDRYLDTAWTVQIIRGLVLAAILYAVAPVVSVFYEDPEIIPLLRIMSLTVALAGFTNIGMVYIRKELEFHKQFAYDVITNLASFVVGVVLAYKTQSVWALVWAGLSGRIACVVFSYVFHPYRPRLRMDTAQARELFQYGRWVLTSSVLILLATQGDDAVLGKMLGLSALGVYQLAYRISNVPATQVSKTVASAAFPAYSKIAGDLARFRNAYLRTLSVTMCLSIPVAAGIAAIAPWFIPLVLGSRWMPTVGPIQVLCLFGVLRAYGAALQPVFYASGRPKELTKVMFVQVVFTALLIWPLTQLYGVPGTALCVTVAALFAQAYGTYRAAALIEVKVKDIVLVLGQHLALGLMIFSSARAIVVFLPGSYLMMAVAVLAGVAAFFVGIAVLYALGFDGPVAALRPLLRVAGDTFGAVLRSVGNLYRRVKDKLTGREKP